MFSFDLSRHILDYIGLFEKLFSRSLLQNIDLTCDNCVCVCALSKVERETERGLSTRLAKSDSS